MNSNQSVEEVMEWVRGQVRAGSKSGVPGHPVTPMSGDMHPPSQQALSPLRDEVQSCVATHGEVGQLNPRLPGLHNSAIQLVKKTIRRSLSWYTRPLHLFQASVTRALQSVSGVLETHDDALRQVAVELARQEAAIQDLQRKSSAPTQRHVTPEFQPVNHQRETATATEPAPISAVANRKGPLLRENDEIIDYWNRAAEVDPMHETVSQAAGESDEEYLQNWTQSGEYVASKIMSCSPANPVALEVGPGMGRITIPMSRYCQSIVALDISPQMVLRTRETLSGLANLEVQVISDEDLSFLPSEHFDLAYAIACFQHAQKKSFYRYLRGLRRALKPGGVLFFGVMNLCSERGFGHFDAILKNDYPEFFHTPDEIACYLTHAAFSSHKLEYEGETLFATAYR